MRKIKDFHEAWHFLRNHQAFNAKGTARDTNDSRFHEALEIDVVKIDARGKINNNPAKNTRTAVWLECGPIKDPDPKLVANGHYPPEAVARGAVSHDINLDCGAPTFEAAIVKLANLVIKHYGDWPPLLEQIAEAAR